MIRALHVIERMVGWGGTPRKILSLARHSDTERVSSTLLTFAGPSALDAELASYGWNVESRSFGRFSAAFLEAIVEIARAERSDVICTHFKRPLAYGSLASKITRIPFVHFEHSNPFLGSEKASKQLAANAAIVGCRLVVANSRHTARKCREFYGAGMPIVVLPNPAEVGSLGGDDADLCELRSELTGRFVCVAVGGFIPLRDHSTLLDGLERLVRDENALRCTLLVVGGGAGQAAFEAEVRWKSLGDVVHCLGYRTPAYRYFSLADCFVSAAIDEGFGTAVAEAMLCGLPVVLADSGAYPELVDASSGVLFPPHDGDALAAALRRLADNPREARSVGAAAAVRARLMCDPLSYAERICDLLTRAANRERFNPGVQAIGWPESDRGSTDPR